MLSHNMGSSYHGKFVFTNYMDHLWRFVYIIFVFNWRPNLPQYQTEKKALARSHAFCLNWHTKETHKILHVHVHLNEWRTHTKFSYWSLLHIEPKKAPTQIRLSVWWLKCLTKLAWRSQQERQTFFRSLFLIILNVYCFDWFYHQIIVSLVKIWWFRFIYVMCLLFSLLCASDTFWSQCSFLQSFRSYLFKTNLC